MVDTGEPPAGVVLVVVHALVVGLGVGQASGVLLGALKSAADIVGVRGGGESGPRLSLNDIDLTPPQRTRARPPKGKEQYLTPRVYLRYSRRTGIGMRLKDSIQRHQLLLWTSHLPENHRRATCHQR